MVRHVASREGKVLLEIDGEELETTIRTLSREGKVGLAGMLAGMLLPHAEPDGFHQGHLLDGSAHRQDRRWVAVILHELEVREACKAEGVTFDSLEMDAVVERYTEALLDDGGWFEILKLIVADEGEHDSAIEEDRMQSDGERAPQEGGA
jgi:hypothetical protein